MTTPAVPESRRRKSGEQAAEWTDAAQAAPVEAEPTKKLSLAIPESIHHAEKMGAAARKNTMLAEMVELLAARNGLGPWPTDVVASVLAQVGKSGETDTPAAPKPRSSRAKRSA